MEHQHGTRYLTSNGVMVCKGCDPENFNWLIVARMHNMPITATVLTTVDSGDVTEVESFVAWRGDRSVFVKFFDDPENHLQVNGKFIATGENAGEEADEICYLAERLLAVEYIVQTITG